MTDQYQETPEGRKAIPEERKQHIMVLLARIIQQRLTATTNSKEHTAGKGLELGGHLRPDVWGPHCVAYSDPLGAEPCRV